MCASTTVSINKLTLSETHLQTYKLTVVNTQYSLLNKILMLSRYPCGQSGERIEERTCTEPQERVQARHRQRTQRVFS
jgi:hypothetical protein